MFIRPPRATYNIQDLGPSVRTISNIAVRRIDFELKNKNNFTLKCSFFQALDPKTSQQSSSICVIYLHGNAGSRIESLSLMPFVIENGMNFCSFDFAGCGLSEGEYISLGIHEKDDVILLKTNLKAKFGIKEVALWGRSMGAVTAIHVAAKENDIFAMICDSPFLKLSRLAAEFAKENKNFSSFFTSIIFSFVKKSIKKRANFSVDALDQNAMIKQCKTPICFVTSKDDKFVKAYNVEELHGNYKGTKKLLYEKGDHNAQRSLEFYLEGNKFLKESLLAKILPEIKGKNDDKEERKSMDEGRNMENRNSENKRVKLTQNDIIKKFSIMNQRFEDNNGGKAFPIQNNYYQPSTQI